MDEAAWLDLAKTYGIAGILCIVFIGIFKSVLAHYQKSLDKKDEQNLIIIDQFSKTNEKHSQAVVLVKESLVELCSTLRSHSDTVNRAFDQAQNEHSQILQFVNRKA